MRKSLLVCSLLLVGACGLSTYDGLTPIGAEQKYGVMGTAQTCSHGPAVARAADLALVLIARDADRAGIIGYEALGDSLREAPLWVCLIAQPESCGGSKARKAGCTHGTGTTLWVARYWPPICDPAWPEEPHCVLDPQQQREAWEATLLHELVNVVVLRAGASPDYNTAVYQPGGIESRAMAIYRAARAAEQE